MKELEGDVVHDRFEGQHLLAFGGLCDTESHTCGLNPPIQVVTATWSKAGQLDWWVKERQEWWGRARGAGGRQQWIRGVDPRPASGSQPDHSR